MDLPIMYVIYDGQIANDSKDESESRLVWLLVTPWTIQSMEFSRPEYWSR